MQKLYGEKRMKNNNKIIIQYKCIIEKNPRKFCVLQNNEFELFSNR